MAPLWTAMSGWFHRLTGAHERRRRTTAALAEFARAQETTERATAAIRANAGEMRRRTRARATGNVAADLVTGSLPPRRGRP